MDFQKSEAFDYSPTDVGVVLRRSCIPSIDLVFLAEPGDLLVSYGDRNVALVRQQYNRYARAIRQRNLLPQIAQPLLHRLKGRRA